MVCDKFRWRAAASYKSRLCGFVRFFLSCRHMLSSRTPSNWEIQIASGKTCTKGLKYGSVAISNVKLTAPPEFGKVTVQGPGFSYTANRPGLSALGGPSADSRS